jgi:hypothetical protein
MNRRSVLLSAFALAGCASVGTQVAPAAPLAELEPVYAAVAGREGLTIQVASNGCTAKADFAAYVERKENMMTVSFGRKRIDTCKSFAMGKTQLSFSWAELGVEARTPLFLLNPLVAWTGPGS